MPETKKKRRRLTDMRIDKVDLVDAGANLRRFVFFKREKESAMSGATIDRAEVAAALQGLRESFAKLRGSQGIDKILEQLEPIEVRFSALVDKVTKGELPASLKDELGELQAAIDKVTKGLEDEPAPAPETPPAPAPAPEVPPAPAPAPETPPAPEPEKGEVAKKLAALSQLGLAKAVSVRTLKELGAQSAEALDAVLEPLGQLLEVLKLQKGEVGADPQLAGLDGAQAASLMASELNALSATCTVLLAVSAAGLELDEAGKGTLGELYKRLLGFRQGQPDRVQAAKSVKTFLDLVNSTAERALVLASQARTAGKDAETVARLDAIVTKMQGVLEHETVKQGRFDLLVFNLVADAGRELDTLGKALEAPPAQPQSVVDALTAELQKAKAESDTLRAEIAKARKTVQPPAGTGEPATDGDLDLWPMNINEPGYRAKARKHFGIEK